MKDILDLLEDLIEAYDALEYEGIGPEPSVEDYEAIATYLEAGGRNADQARIRKANLVDLTLRAKRWDSHRAGWEEQGYLNMHTVCSVCGAKPFEFWDTFCNVSN